MPSLHAADCILPDLFGTVQLAEYCQARGILFERVDGDEGASLRRWHAALETLPPEQRADIELEIAQVADLANREAICHLIDVCAGRSLPTDLAVGEAAQSLWFLLHHPGVFEEAYFHFQTRTIESWRCALTRPGIDLTDHARRRLAFEREMLACFRMFEGTGRFCASRSHRLTEPPCTVFTAYVSGHTRLVDVFTEEGEHARRPLRPATMVAFAYYEDDGAILLKSRCRAREKVLAFFQGFCRAVLGSDLDIASLNRRFDLHRLLTPFDPPLPEGVRQVRVQALELAYPVTEGRRRLRLATNVSDAPGAITELLQRHGGGELERRRLAVVQADLLVTLAVRGRAKHCLIRLWPSRCSLGSAPASDVLRRCLQSWGLSCHDSAA
jgi:hypothetical protein